MLYIFHILEYLSPEMHRKAVLASSNSLNSFVSDAIQEKLMRLGI